MNELSPGKAKRKGRLWPAVYIMAFFVIAGVLLHLALRDVPYHILMAVVGFFAAFGFILHRVLPARRKRVAHAVSFLAIGIGLFLGAGVFGRQNQQIEGFFFDLFLGIFGGALVHYLTAKIVGPLFVGRLWCGWGCWTFSLLNFLPYQTGKRATERAPYSKIRTVHFLVVLAGVAFLVFAIGYSPGVDWKTTRAPIWYLTGNALYFLAGIVLAFIHKDNRAFCKILCPITVILKFTARPALLKIGPTASACNNCGACSKVCPMAVDVSGYISSGKRVLSTECVLCRQCVEACPHGACDMGLGFDLSR